MVKKTPVDDGEIKRLKLNAARAIGATFKSNQMRSSTTQASRRNKVSLLSLEESIRAAFSPLDTQGNHPSRRQRVRLKDLAFCLIHHPTMQKIKASPVISKKARRRRRHDALKRAIKAIPEIRREGSTKDSYYIYDSSAVESDTVLSAMLEQIIRYPPSNASDIISMMDIMDSDTLIDSLHTLEAESALDFDEYKFELKPRIWEVSPGGKHTLTVTLRKHTLNLFDELAARFTAIQEFTEDGTPEDEISDCEYGFRQWNELFDDIPFPMVPMSKSMIVEIALWNLWKQYLGPRTDGVPVDASSEGLEKRSKRIESAADDEYASLVSRLQTLEEKLAKL